MKRIFLLNNGIALSIICLIIIFLIISSFINRNNTYKQGLECFENQDWLCVVQKFKKLNYKDSKEKLKMASYELKLQAYENYLQTAKDSLEKKLYKKALEQYQNALLLEPNNNEIKIKIESLKIIVNEQQKREEDKRKKQEEENSRISIKSKISNTAVYPIPTKMGEGYDETIRKYGIVTINRINKLAPKAAELVASNPRCTRVMAVDVADDRSTRNSITFFVDCGDIQHIADVQRYYVNEREISANIIPKSVKEQSESIDSSQYLLMCEAEIKARLTFPSTFKPNIIASSVSKAPMNTVVRIPFKAKNAFNLELKHKGICYYNGVTLTEISINEE